MAGCMRGRDDTLYRSPDRPVEEYQALVCGGMVVVFYHPGSGDRIGGYRPPWNGRSICLYPAYGAFYPTGMGIAGGFGEIPFCKDRGDRTGRGGDFRFGVYIIPPGRLLEEQHCALSTHRQSYIEQPYRPS